MRIDDRLLVSRITVRCDHIDDLESSCVTFPGFSLLDALIQVGWTEDGGSWPIEHFCEEHS